MRVGLVPMKEVVRDNIERLERVITEGKRITGLATGYSDLDNLTSGLQTFGTDHLGGAAFGGQDGTGAEHRGKYGSATDALGGHFQPGNVEGIAADAPAGFAWRRSMRINSVPDAWRAKTGSR